MPSISHQEAISYTSYIRSEFCSSLFRAPVDSVVRVSPYYCSTLIYSMVMDVWTLTLFRPNLEGSNQRCGETHCLRHMGTRGVCCIRHEDSRFVRHVGNRLHCVATYLITYLLTYLLTYMLTSWRRVLLEKLTSSRPVKKFYAFYGNRRFITAFTSARHLSLS